ncbi:MAG: methyltransferase domain-containing protein [Roseibium sp.]|uniref:class I SAM-dependent methyltransferase n=1 Tax=Roseibium sp. TaxID=1936156 RepID=UPI00260893F4|nr:methyltransferase domain-containing protein [Roseibium sp.]MCV0424869.1 methyltransferase domain-containing protein [Roseibium sp.]
MRYVIENYDETERLRLTALADLLDPYTFYILEQIDIQPDWKCLEIGAGLGTVSCWIADRLKATGNMLCTDLQTKFIDEIEHPHLRTEKLDITLSPTYSECFDLAVVRTVHQHLADHHSAARNLSKMVRPGGYLLYIEPDIHPAFSDEHPVWKRVWQAIFQWGESRDIDYFTGRKVPGQLSDIGLDVISARGETALFNGAKDGNSVRTVYRMTLDIVMPDLVRLGYLSKADSEEVYSLLDNPDVWLMSFCFFATLARKPICNDD